MTRIRVLIVDDAVVVRRIVTDVLGADPELDVVGTAANGRIALAKIPQVKPDVITLDVEMPEMNGLETLKEVRKLYPALPVIMFSTLTERGASTTLDALTLGASDYVTKPANVGSVAAAQRSLREQLVPKIKVLCARRNSALTSPTVRSVPASAATKPVTARPLEAARSVPVRVNLPVDIVAIGVSTGGPNALAQVLPEFPADFPVPIVIVQHMPPVFTKLLAERLNTQSNLEIHEATDGEALRAGHVYVAPGNYHMVIARDGVTVRIRVHQEAPENSCRPAVDVLFRSVADLYGGGALGVVLTGMGQDGLKGCERIRDSGGLSIAQDEASSVVWGMPGYVARAGLADRVVPLNEVAPEIIRRVKHGRVNSFPSLVGSR